MVFRRFLAYLRDQCNCPVHHRYPRGRNWTQWPGYWETPPELPESTSLSVRLAQLALDLIE